MKIRLAGIFISFVLLDAAFGWWNVAAAVPVPAPSPATVLRTFTIAPLIGPKLIVNNSGNSTFLPPPGGQLSPAGVGGQAAYTQPGGQLMPGSAPGGQLAPGTITGGRAPVPTPGSPIFSPRSTITNYGLPTISNSTAIVTGNSPTTLPGGMLSGNGVGGNSRVIVIGNTTVAPPGGALSGNGEIGRAHV